MNWNPPDAQKLRCRGVGSQCDDRVGGGAQVSLRPGNDRRTNKMTLKMGKVVNLQEQAKGAGGASKRGRSSGQRAAAASRSARRRKRPSKTALVLGGGGFTGAVYEIGALRAPGLLAG